MFDLCKITAKYSAPCAAPQLHTSAPYKDQSSVPFSVLGFSAFFLERNGVVRCERAHFCQVVETEDLSRWLAALYAVSDPELMDCMMSADR
jgi:hypothetical protein